MSAYGWTPQFVLDHVTPAQAALWAERISRRKRTEAALQARLTQLGFAAALHADNGRVFDRVLAELLPGDDPCDSPAGPGERRLSEKDAFTPIPDEPNPAVQHALSEEGK